MSELKKRKRNEVPERKEEDDDIREETPCEVFLSYSHKDYDIAAKIADIFEKFGAKVWFDSTALKGSDLYDQIINEKISECQRFVPILSFTTETERRGYFRKEWSWALDELRFRLGSPYIAPIALDDIDYTSSLIPQKFREAHILSFNTAEFENEIKRLIRSFRQ